MGAQNYAGKSTARRKRVHDVDLFAGISHDAFRAHGEWSVQCFTIGDTIVYEAFPQGSVAPADKIFFGRRVWR